MTAVPADWGVSAVTVRFGDLVALDAVTLRVPPGRVTAVVGGDGAGKTTLLRTLVGQVAPAAGQVTAPAAERIGYLPATAGSWLDLSVSENVAFVGGAYGLRGADLARRSGPLLERAGLAAVPDRLGRELSGGMRRKLGFCLAMLPRPDLLVLDEPSTGVDPVSRVDLWRLVSEAAAGGTAVLMSTTYLDEAERCGHLLVLDAGTPLLSGVPSQVGAAVPGTVLVTPVPVRPEYAWRRGPAFHEWWPTTPPDGAGRPVVPDLEDVVVTATLRRRTPHAEAVDPPAEAADPAAPVTTRPVLVSGHRLTRRFGAFPAVTDVSLQVRAGEVVGLLGANGAGKTTLIRLLLGLLAPTAGESCLLGGPPTRTARSGIGYVPQGLGLYDDLTVRENLAFVADAYHVADPAVPGDLTEYADFLVGSLALGTQRRVAFACALLHRPRLLVLDEPTSGVDPLARARLWDTVHTQADAGVGALVTTHYMQEAQQCDRLLLMSAGRLVGEGSEADLVAGTTAVAVVAEDWAAAFAALQSAGEPVTLYGRHVRVADADPGRLATVLTDAGITARVEQVPATLEERMTVLARQA